MTAILESAPILISDGIAVRPAVTLAGPDLHRLLQLFWSGGALCKDMTTEDAVMHNRICETLYVQADLGHRGVTLVPQMPVE